MSSTERHLPGQTMKMADLMDMNFDLVGVMTRMGIPFGFGDGSIEEVCLSHGINPETFLLICRIYAFDGFRPTVDVLEKASLTDILRYLHLSHDYYMDVAVAELEEALGAMLAPCDEKHQKVIWKFFKDYKEELSKHFAYEEQTVFPHVKAVLERQGKGGFTIGEYERNHSNVQEKLEDLKSLVMKYMPAQCDPKQAYRVLFYIFSLEKDLQKHTLIEDEILVPMVGRMENHD